METKTCTYCHREKNLAQFANNISSPDGKRSQCKQCAKEKQNANDKHRVAGRKHYKDNLDYHRNRKLLYNYGIDTNEYNRILTAQNGKCAICLKDSTILSRRLVVDHDHKTGKVRGLLCHACNLSLGGLEDDVERIQRIIHYLLT